MFRGNIKAKRRFRGAIYQSAKKPDNNVEPDVPDTPVAPLYLYGTPAPTTVTYNGVELPDIESVWTDKETYPYAAIQAVDVSSVVSGAIMYTMAVCTAPIKAGVENTFVTYACTNSQELADMYASVNGLNCDSWIGNVGDMAEQTVVIESVDGFFWTSHDILNADGTTYLAASDPVYTQTGGNIGLRDGDSVTLYDGAVLPNIDTVYTDELKKTHPIAIITKRYAGLTSYSLHMAKSIVYQKDTDGNYQWGITDVLRSVISMLLDQTWGSINEVSGSPWWAATVGDNFAVWTNTDILFEDGTVGTPATDPIPVSGLVGYSYNGIVLPDINEVYTDELKAKYPCMYVFDIPTISSFAPGGCFAYFTDRPFYAKVEGVNMYVCSHGEEPVQYVRYKLVDGVWANKIESSVGGYDNVYDVLWASEDMYIMEHDGDTYTPTETVAFAASDPIPIYE